MKKYVILVINLLLIYIFSLGVIDSGFWPESTSWQVRNILFTIGTIYLLYNLTSIYWLKKIKPEEGFIYTISDAVIRYYQVGVAYIEPFKREFLRSIIITAGIIFLSIVTIGIPGAFLLEIPVWFGLVKSIEGDAMWSAAVLVSMVWPMFIPLSVIMKYEVSKRSSAAVPNYFLAGTIVGGIILVVTWFMF